MNEQDRIDIEIFTAVTRAIAESDELEVMATHLSQLLVGALGIKGCTIFLLNPEADELEILASFGLSIAYLNKGPVLFNRSIGGRSRSEPVVVRSTADAAQLQYPEAAREEGIGAIISLPVRVRGKTIGALRLYHDREWNVSDRDKASLFVLAETVGLAMMYTRLARAMETIRGTVSSVHGVWTG
jgi:transcriptional regulator with GAF, ATPase, and Fis domain